MNKKEFSLTYQESRLETKDDRFSSQTRADLRDKDHLTLNKTAWRNMWASKYSGFLANSQS